MGGRAGDPVRYRHPGAYGNMALEQDGIRGSPIITFNDALSPRGLYLYEKDEKWGLGLGGVRNNNRNSNNIACVVQWPGVTELYVALLKVSSAAG